jgi:hypothetical protein
MPSGCIASAHAPAFPSLPLGSSPHSRSQSNAAGAILAPSRSSTTATPLPPSLAPSALPLLAHLPASTAAGIAVGRDRSGCRFHHRSWPPLAHRRRPRCALPSSLLRRASTSSRLGGANALPPVRCLARSWPAHGDLHRQLVGVRHHHSSSFPSVAPPAPPDVARRAEHGVAHHFTGGQAAGEIWPAEHLPCFPVYDGWDRSVRGSRLSVPQGWIWGTQWGAPSILDRFLKKMFSKMITEID